MDNVYTLVTSAGSFVTDCGDGLFHHWTNLEGAEKWKLSEVIALKEKYPNAFTRMGIKIHKVELAIGEEVKL